ncbi:hypothetical protein BT96DRAFT_986728 [Gymnopus androsaceus JB14]|uniref:Uncharacterized protein n=1 Tax=Gymnopus androsaceus JB14 TaxID=1447944 RepID=A0A6A4IA04_9AGAR|nr:hypothetical protein BT96DRAFT_986728 [Gymnopus androsaceus JB14]
MSIIFTTSLSSTYLSDIEKNSTPLSSFTIRVPPPLILSEVPLRERRGFTEASLNRELVRLPRRRRASSNAKPVITKLPVCESRMFDFAGSDSDSSDEEWISCSVQ